MSTEGQIKEILKEHPTMSYNDIARKIGYSICKSMRYKLFE